jgi:hypothetical protein
VPSKADPARALADILENIGRIEAYVAGLDQEAFGRDALRRDAVERCLERLCEAAFRLGDHASQLAPHQPWADIRGMGTDSVTLTTASTSRSSGTPSSTGYRASKPMPGKRWRVWRPKGGS